MKAPTEIIDLLQPIVSIYFYDIQHKNRSILILSDNVAEISCKLKILEDKPSEDLRKVDFPELLEIVEISGDLKRDLLKFHKLRNEFQHRSPMYTVEEKTCADSVITTIDTIKFLWQEGALKDIPDWVDCGLRVINLFSSKGKMEREKKLESKIINEIDLYIDDTLLESNILINEDGQFVKGDFTGSVVEKRFPNKNEAIIQVYLPKYWTYLFQNHTSIIEQILNEVGIEEI